MSFRNLQERIELLGQTEKFQEIYETVKDLEEGDYATTLAYFLSVINDLDANTVTDFAIIGGYAHLLHLVDLLGEKVLTKWRGSGDLDMAARTETVESVMRGQYKQFKRKPSHFDQRKIDIELSDETLESKCKVDLYLAFRDKPIHLQAYSIQDDFWTRVETVKVFGIEVPVASKTDLLHMKLAIDTPRNGIPRQHDIYDIFTILRLIETTQDLDDTWKELPDYAKVMLQRIFNLKEYDTNQKIVDLELIQCPSKKYLKDLRTRAKTVRE